MVHKILGWIFGYLRIRFREEGMERFINLCHHHGINLWQIYPDPSHQEIYASISLKDYKRIRKIAQKTKVWPRITQRHGAPFVWMAMKKRNSFFIGLVVWIGLVLFFSTRIWSIQIAGEQYHTKESLLRYLETEQIHLGMAGAEVSCSRIEEQIRKQYEDIGWVSIKKSGSTLYLQVQEVRLEEEETKEEPAHLVASCSGTVVQIVTRQGTAEVHQGDKVRKGDVLISGIVTIIGDNETQVGKQYVRAQGDVMIESNKKYRDEWQIKQKETVYTGAEKKLFQWNLGGTEFFLHNPLNHLESRQKYDIIREGGPFCTLLSAYFPMEYWVTTYRAVAVREREYNETEATAALQKRWQEYLQRKQEQGWQLQQSAPQINRQNDRYVWEDPIVWWKAQKKMKKISAKTMQAEKTGQEQDDTAVQNGENDGNHGDVN